MLGYEMLGNRMVSDRELWRHTALTLWQTIEKMRIAQYKPEEIRRMENLFYEIARAENYLHIAQMLKQSGGSQHTAATENGGGWR